MKRKFFDRFKGTNSKHIQTILNKHSILCIVSFSVCIGEVLFPIWFFQGIEKMKYITFINIISKCFFILLIIIFVNDKNDYLYIPIFTALGNGVGALYSFYILLFKEKIKIVLPIKTELLYFFNSVNFFFGNDFV